MPLLEIEKSGRIIVAEPSLKSHLTKAEETRSRLKFHEYVRQFGIFDLGEMTTSQLFALVAARNIAPAIDLIRIPKGKNKHGFDGLSGYDQNRPKSSIGAAMLQFITPSPSLNQEWEILRDPEDIPEAAPEDLLLRRLAPKEFLRRMTEGELLKSTWTQEEEDDLLNQEKLSPDQSIVQEQSAEEDHSPYGYVLLDASESMGSARDCRGEIARGLALSFLLNQFENGNPCIVYLFRSDLSMPIGGDNRHEFERAVGAILGHDHKGMTNLQGTLGAMAEHLLQDRERVDIALITDGITRLTENPLGDAHLHTFLLGAAPEELDKQGEIQYRDSLLKLDYWSDFCLKFGSEEMNWVSIPDVKDIISLAPLLHSFEVEFIQAASSDKVRQLQRRLANIKALLDRFQTLNEPKSDPIINLEIRTNDLIEKYGSLDPVNVSRENSLKWTQVDRDLSLMLETRELRGVLSEKLIPDGFSLHGKGQQFGNLWEMLWNLILQLLRFNRSPKGIN